MNRNFIYVMIGLVLGVALGTMSYYSLPDKAVATDVAKNMSLVSSIFLKLIKMIIGPLVLSTLVVGIGHMGDAATVGRVGAKTMAWFVSASIVSLLLGLFMVDLLQPGVGIVIADSGSNAANLTTQAFSLDNFIDHVVPTSIFKSLADGEILQIVVFSVFAGVAIMAMGEERDSEAADRTRRRRRAHDAQHYRVRDEAGADRGLRFGRFSRSPNPAPASC